MVSFEAGAREWIDAWRTIFREEELDLWSDQSLGTSEDWAGRFDQSLDEARAVVVLLSEKYLHSEYRRHQRAWREIDKTNESGKLVVLVVLERCPWEEVGELRLIVSREGRSRVVDLSDLAPEERRNRAWPALGAELRREFLPDAPPVTESDPERRQSWIPRSRIDDFQLAQAPRQIIQVATELVQRQGQGLLPLSTSCLLFSLGGWMTKSEPVLGRAASFVIRFLNENAKVGLEEVQERFFKFNLSRAGAQRPEPTELDRIHTGESMTPNVVALLDQTVELARATTGGAAESRHLLAALLCAGDRPFGARKRLEEMGIDQNRLRAEFLKFIEATHPEDDQENWRAMMEGRPPPEGKRAQPNLKSNKGRKSPEQSPAQQATTEAPSPALPGVLMAGFDADFWRQRGRAEGDPNPDLLDIKDEVNALASLTAAWSVEPPLSIGLFGDWGSGKTFFMRKMMDRVDELAQAARDSGKQQKDIAFYKNIVQIEFNAWHYVEGNLWASLVEHIFSNLRLAGTGDADDPDGINRLREKLFKDLNVAQEIKKAAAARVAELESARDKAKERHQEAKSAHDEQAKELAAVSAKDVWKEIKGIVLSDAQKQRLIELGFSEQLTATTRDLHQTLEQMRATGGRAWAQAGLYFNLLKRPGQIWLIAASLLGIGFVGGLAAWLSKQLGLGESSGVLSFSAQGVALVTGALAWLRRQSVRVSGTLDLLEPVRQKIEQELKSAEAKRDEQVTNLEKSVALLGAECVEARREVEKAEQSVAELEAKLAEATPARQLARFIEDRAASEDYRRHLGILAVIRRDFEKLARLVAGQREEERQGTEPLADPTRINRIILYVDDLDRCPAHKVVEVLQAIHLLLAFPLFVVVVGVDSRWISRSLEQTYVALLNPPVEGGKGDDSERLPGHGATPRDYLEKIFQIPFWIRPMQAVDCRKLIGGLTEDSTEPGSKPLPTPEKIAPASSVVGHRPTAAANAGHEPSKIADTSAQAVADQNVASPRPPADAPQPKDRADAIVGSTATVEAKSGVKKAEPVRVELTPRTLRLEPSELEFMNELTEVLTRSPRSVKRFINCYRLIKAHLRPEQLDAFVGNANGGGGYEPVLLLLAILNGAPVVADKILDRLTNPCPLFTFQDLMGALKTFAGSGGWKPLQDAATEYWNTQPDRLRQRHVSAQQLVEELNLFVGAEQGSSPHNELCKHLKSFSKRLDKYSLMQLVLELNADTELAARPEWARVHDFLGAYARSKPARGDLQSLRRAAPFVARFSFRVADVRQGELRREQETAPTAPAA